MSDTNNGTRKKKRFPLKINVGLVVYTVIALYLVINLILYVTRDHISFSEVEYGRIEDSDTFTGLALRSVCWHKTAAVLTAPISLLP